MVVQKEEVAHWQPLLFDYFFSSEFSGCSG
jgi:hypothetical protein